MVPLVMLSLTLATHMPTQSPTVPAPAQREVCTRGVAAFYPMSRGFTPRAVVAIKDGGLVKVRFTYTFTTARRQLSGMAECFFMAKGKSISATTNHVEMTSNGATEIITKRKDLDCFNAGKYC
jgi:hypothetical protein